jgi:hypothetical protein
MEMFGIVLSIPAAVVGTAIYLQIVVKAVLRFPHLNPVLIRLSYLVLGLFAIEGTMLLAMGTQAVFAFVTVLFSYGVSGR